MPIYVAPGASFEAAAQNLIPNMEGTARVGIYDEPAGGTAVYGPSTAGIVESPAGSGFYGKSDLVAPGTGGQYWLKWDSGVGTAVAVEELVVAYTNPALVTGPTFATPEDVAARLGRELTAAEEDTVDFLLLAATAVITDAVGKTAEWAQGLDVPPVLRFVCVELVVRALANPDGSNATREQLGEYSYSQSFGEYGGLSLIAAWERMVRLAVWGTGAASARTDSIAFDAEPRV